LGEVAHTRIARAGAMDLSETNHARRNHAARAERCPNGVSLSGLAADIDRAKIVWEICRETNPDDFVFDQSDAGGGPFSQHQAEPMGALLRSRLV
jgi:hypothetical protein